MGSFSITGNNVTIECVYPCTQIVIRNIYTYTASSNKSISFDQVDSKLIGKAVVIDLGLTINSVFNLRNSIINASGQVINGHGTISSKNSKDVIKSQFVDYTGSTNSAYGNAYLKPESLEGYTNFISNDQYYGSGCQLNKTDINNDTMEKVKFAKGGGLIFISVFVLNFYKDSKIEANGNIKSSLTEEEIETLEKQTCSNEAGYKFAGTGGTIIINSDLNFIIEKKTFDKKKSLSPSFFLIEAKGGYYKDQEDDYAGSGGRIYINFLKSVQDYSNLIELAGNVSATAICDHLGLVKYSADGTIQLYNDQTKVIVLIIKGQKQQNVTLKSRNEKSKRAKNLTQPYPHTSELKEIYITTTLQADYFNPDQYVLEGTIYCFFLYTDVKIGYRIMNIQNFFSNYSSVSYYYSSDENNQVNSVKTLNGIYNCDASVVLCRELQVKNMFRLLATDINFYVSTSNKFYFFMKSINNFIESFKSSFDFGINTHVTIESDIGLVFSSTKLTGLEYDIYVDNPKDFITDSRSSIVLKTKKNIRMNRSNILFPKIILYCAEKDIHQVSSQLISPDTFCRTEEFYKQLNNFIKNYVKTDGDMKENVWNNLGNFVSELDTFKYKNSTINSGVFLIAYGEISIKSADKLHANKIRAGYVFAVSKYFKMYGTSDTKFPIITSTSLGCRGDNINNNQLKSKYFKQCGALGGRGNGRGTWSSSAAFNICKSFNNNGQRDEYIKVPTSGKGGEIKDFSANQKNLCFGGGIIYILTFFLESSGIYRANGGQAQNKDYVSCAGGGGGSIKLVSKEIILDLDIEAKGGNGDENLGAGGGGKLIFHSLSDHLNPYDKIKNSTLNIPDFIKKNLSHGSLTDYNRDLQYSFTQYNFLNARPSLFQGNIINDKECGSGAEGLLCNPCPIHKFKTMFGHQDCHSCPCTQDKSKDADNVDQVRVGIESCNCLPIIFENIYLPCLGLQFLFMTLFMVIMNFAQKSFEKKSVYRKDIKLRIADIPYSVRKIIVKGSNFPHDCWRLPKVGKLELDVVKKYNYDLFSEEFQTICQWSLRQIVLLNILYYTSYSPQYLLILRHMQDLKANSVIQLIENQRKYKLFDNKNLALKWCLSKDNTSLSIEVVEFIQLPKYDWHFNFPMIFPIIGEAWYEKPLKLNLKNPNIIKLIDYLKDYVVDDKEYFEEFGIPEYLRSAVIDVESFGTHFLEFYFCVLAFRFKGCTSNQPQEVFVRRFAKLNNMVYNGNVKLFNKVGFEMQIKLYLVRKFCKSNSDKKQRKNICIDLVKSNKDLISKNGVLLYNILNHKKQDVKIHQNFVLEHNIDKIQINSIFRKSIFELKNNIMAKKNESMSQEFKSKMNLLKKMLRKNKSNQNSTKNESTFNSLDTTTNYNNISLDTDINSKSARHIGKSTTRNSKLQHLLNDLSTVENISKLDNTDMSYDHTLLNLTWQEGNLKKESGNLKKESGNSKKPLILDETPSESLKETVILKNHSENKIKPKQSTQNFLKGDSSSDSKSTEGHDNQSIKDIQNTYRIQSFVQKMTIEPEELNYKDIYFEYIYIKGQKTWQQNFIWKYISWIIHSHSLSKYRIVFADYIQFIQLGLEIGLIIFTNIAGLLLLERLNVFHYLIFIENQLFIPFIYMISTLQGVLTLIASNNVKIGKMYCTCNYQAFWNCLVILILYIIVMYFSQQLSFNMPIVLMILKVIIKLPNGQLACMIVSRNQNTKTIKEVVIQCQKTY